ncbi:Pumilio y domain member 6 [Recurvomyces mirabilis]|nr:Pumilio y domain member 6 [Recurvomyces mirabilis]
MAATKRKEAPSAAAKDVKKQKRVSSKKSRLDAAAAEDEDFGGFSDGEENEVRAPPAKANGSSNNNDSKSFKLETSSAEAHAKQRQLAKERKAAKPNADVIARSKKIWERLRRKSHVPLEERKQLTAELFEIITGRVREFVFKHDSVRVIQTALKYADRTQRRIIVEELKGDVRELVESRYGKFLVAKMVVEGDQQVRNIIVPQFYGGVKKLINHPEAGWIVDDIYRQIATTQQKAVMLREWYGQEFALANRNVKAEDAEKESADLKAILEKTPEKRRPILEHLLQMINSLIQKKMTGFTMVHDAMLQYFLALSPGTEEFTDFLELLKADIETKAEAKDSTDVAGGGDLYRNLAFTKSGSRVVCLALAYGSAKDRKVILRCYKDNVELMSLDQYAKMVLITGLDVPDDVKMSGKAILSELLGQSVEGEEARLNRLEEVSTNLISRVPLLYPLAGDAKWLMNDQDKALLTEIHEIRKTTSKKDPDLRRKGLMEYLAPPMLEFVAKRCGNLVKTSFGCQVLTETLLEASSDSASSQKEDAKAAVAQLAHGNPLDAKHVAANAAVGRMLKTLVLGGAFDPETKTTKLAEVRKALEKGKKSIEKAAKGADVAQADAGSDGEKSKKKKAEGGKGNAGAKILLEKLKA